MEYLSRSRLPVFTPRLDLTAEDLNAEAETLCAAINELAGRLFIIKDMIPKEERSQYAEEESYPILDEIERIWEDIQRAWETIEKNKEECEAHYEETMARITELDERLNKLIQDVKQELLNVIDAVDKKHDTEEERIENKFDTSFADLEKRFNALDDAAARKADLATVFDRIKYIQDNSIPNVGSDGYWYIGKIRTNTKAQGEPGQGVPRGGKKGQTLIKNSDKDFDTIWGASAGGVTAITVDEYVTGMEEEIPILVVYKEPHVIDPATDLLLATGSTLVSEKDSEVSYTIVGEPGVTRSTNYYIRMNNTSSNQYIRFNTVRFYVYDEYGTYLTDVYVSFNNTTDGSNIIAPDTESASAALFVPLNAAYVVVAEEQYETGIPMENPEEIGNIIVRDIGIKEMRDMILEVESYENQIAVVKVTNPTENRIRYPQFNMIFRDYYCFDLHISETHDFTLNPGESRSFSMITPIFYLAIFDNKTEIIPEVELQPYHMVPEVGNEVIAGDYKYKLTEFSTSNNMSTVELEVTNMLDFTVQPPIGEASLGFQLFDKYGTPIADLIGYAPNTMVAGATQKIGSSIDMDLSNAAYIEFDSTFFTHLDNTTHLIPVEGSKIVTSDGSLELEYVSHETVDSTSTLHLKVTNLTDAEVPVDDKIILYNPIGTEIITLAIFAGMLDAGSSKVTSSSYGDNAVGRGLYYMEYRKESE